MSPEEAWLIAHNLRPRDQEEMAECGWTVDGMVQALTTHALCERVFAADYQPAAFIRFDEITPKTLVVSMLATEAWPKVARAAYRWGVRECRPHLLKLGYERAECRTMDGHEDAIRMLEHLGFVLECRVPRFGKTGKTFLQYAWRITDHRADYLDQRLADQRAGRLTECASNHLNS